MTDNKQEEARNHSNEDSGDQITVVIIRKNIDETLSRRSIQILFNIFLSRKLNFYEQGKKK